AGSHCPEAHISTYSVIVVLNGGRYNDDTARRGSYPNLGTLSLTTLDAATAKVAGSLRMPMVRDSSGGYGPQVGSLELSFRLDLAAPGAAPRLGALNGHPSDVGLAQSVLLRCLAAHTRRRPGHLWLNRVGEERLGSAGDL